MIDRAHAIASRPGRHLLLVRRHAPRARLARRPACSSSRRARDVRIVYSPLDAVNLAAANPDRKVVFFAIGFETTAPANAMAVWLARKRRLTNFSVLVSHVLVPPAMTAILRGAGQPRAGLPRPGPRLHRDGLRANTSRSPARYRVPIVITGFEPLDLLEGRAAGRCGSSRRAAPRSRTSTPAPSAARATRSRGG